MVGYYLQMTLYRIKELPLLDVVTLIQQKVVTFRFTKDNLTIEQLNEINRRIIDKIMTDGYAMGASTQLKDKIVLRMCTINPRTTEDDIRQTIEKIATFGQELSTS